MTAGMLLFAILILAPLNNVFAANGISDELRRVIDMDLSMFVPGESGGACIGGSLAGDPPSSLTGGTNQEKVWNYFIARGLTPVAAAGAMGNMQQENGAFDPYVGESGDTSWDQSVGGVGFGLIQWTNTGGAGADGRRGKLIQYLKDNGITGPSEDDIDKAILLQLNWLWDGEYGEMIWQEQLNAETTVDGDASRSSSLVYSDQKGNGSTMAFHALVERSADNAEGLQIRINNAKGFLEQFGKNALVGACSSGLISGGMNLEQAQAFMQEYIDLQTKYLNNSRRGLVEINDFDEPMELYFSNCSGGGGPLGNCSTFVGYFVQRHTTGSSVSVNGGQMVQSLLATNSGFVDGGSVPKPYAVFSFSTAGYGHTGVILGVDTANNTIVTGEASCSSPASYTGAHTYTMEGFAAKNPTYAYTDNILKGIGGE